MDGFFSNFSGFDRHVLNSHSHIPALVFTKIRIEIIKSNMNKLNDIIVLEQNNNNEVTINTIRIGNDKIKVNFVQNSISQTNVPLNFKPILYSKPETIFYCTIEGKQHSREWLLFQNNKFYCVYCVCFSALDERNPFIKGVEYIRNCRVSEKLKSHEAQTNHKLAKATYSNLISNCSTQEGLHHSETEEIIGIVVKIIIFIATHGKYLL